LEGLSLGPTSASLLADWLHERSGGSPFILAEIIAQLRAEAILATAGPELHLDTARWLRWRATFSLPETTFDLVAWRLANLPLEARQLLEALAVAGHPLAPALLAGTTGVAPESVSRLVDDLTARGLALERPDGTLALLRRRTLHCALAQGLEAAGAPGNMPLRQIALHAVAGEDLERARRYGLPVLDDLARSHRGPEALNFVHQLYDLLAPVATPGERLRLSRVLGDLHQSLGQLEAAGRWRRRHLVWATEAGDMAAVADAHYALSELALVSYDFRVAVQSAEAGLQAAANRAGPAALGRGRRLLGAALAMDGEDLSGAERHLRQAADDLRASGSPEDLCAALFELGNVAAQRGQLGRALDFYAEAAQTAEAGRVHYYLALAHNNLAYHNLLLGQVESARRSAAIGLKVCEAHDLLSPLLHLFSTQGEVHLYLGEWAAASEAFGRGLALAEELGSLERQAGCRGGMALAARGRGDPAEALRLLSEALLLLAGQGYWHLRARLEIWQAETLLALGRLDEAQACLDAALQTSVSHGRALLLIQAERLKACLLAEQGDWTAAETVFAGLVQRARESGTALEVARTRAAWASTATRRAPRAANIASLRQMAQAAFEAAGAAADLAALGSAP
jgi:tetratricopeptide (TPR) repeat protein